MIVTMFDEYNYTDRNTDNADEINNDIEIGIDPLTNSSIQINSQYFPDNRQSTANTSWTIVAPLGAHMRIFVTHFYTLASANSLTVELQNGTIIRYFLLLIINNYYFSLTVYDILFNSPYFYIQTNKIIIHYVDNLPISFDNTLSLQITAYMPGN